MKNFRTLAQARKDMKVFQDYIELIEQYNPMNVTQHVIYQYVQEGSIVRTAENLNQLGLTLDGRSIESQDISSTLQSLPDPDDLLHKEVRRLYMKKIRNNLSK